MNKPLTNEGIWKIVKRKWNNMEGGAWSPSEAVKEALKLKDKQITEAVKELKEEFDRRGFMEVYDEGNSFQNFIDKIFGNFVENLE